MMAAHGVYLAGCRLQIVYWPFLARGRRRIQTNERRPPSVTGAAAAADDYSFSALTGTTVLALLAGSTVDSTPTATRAAKSAAGTP